MKAIIESTDKIVELLMREGEHPIQARIWEGTTEGGVSFHAYITRIAVLHSDDNGQFDAELKQMRTPSAHVAAIPMRLIL